MQFNLNKTIMRNFLDNLLENKLPEPKPAPRLADVVEQARQEWLAAQSYYNSVTDKDLVDHAVYLMQAAEKKYIYLLKQARRNGVTHSLYLPELSHEDDEREDEKASRRH